MNYVSFGRDRSIVYNIYIWVVFTVSEKLEWDVEYNYEVLNKNDTYIDYNISPIIVINQGMDKMFVFNDMIRQIRSFTQ